MTVELAHTPPRRKVELRKPGIEHGERIGSVLNRGRLSRVRVVLVNSTPRPIEDDDLDLRLRHDMQLHDRSDATINWPHAVSSTALQHLEPHVSSHDTESVRSRHGRVQDVSRKVAKAVAAKVQAEADALDKRLHREIAGRSHQTMNWTYAAAPPLETPMEAPMEAHAGKDEETAPADRT